MSVGEARSAPADPRPQALEPQHWRRAVGALHIRMQLKKTQQQQQQQEQQRFYRRGEDESVLLGEDAEQWGGDGSELMLFMYNQITSLWSTLVPQESGSGSPQRHRVGGHLHTCTYSERR